mmetsp:Transcript_29958/g.67756  ORF Transcript_29958/g.67756 Transcript_29958/m.67756 type:complete len:96 (+) Transcript_29958:483-770(+)
MEVEVKGSDDGARPQRVRIPSFPLPPGSRIAQVSLKPENLILPAGARAHVVNLSKGTQWNSKVGKVLGYDRSDGRYTVQMSEAQQLRVKLENLLL